MILVDADVDVHRDAEVWLRVGTHVDPSRDVFFSTVAAGIDNHSSSQPHVGSRMAIDATAKFPE